MTRKTVNGMKGRGICVVCKRR